jgi:hypothetical protein
VAFWEVPGEVEMYRCSICSDALPYVRTCEQAHAGFCHDCWRLSLSGNPLESRGHAAPIPLVVGEAMADLAPTLPPAYEAQRAAYMATMEAYHARFGEAYDQTLRQLLGPGEDT